MIYVTGDTHGDFSRFTKKSEFRVKYHPYEDDYIIVCGDFGLLWAKDRTLVYHLDWMSKIPFTILWVQGNHENFDLIEEYPIEKWNGGNVRHIIRDKIILLERGQLFRIDQKTFFTFGGGSSHDIQGGILDRNSSTYKEERIKAVKRGLSYRVLGESWWEKELPTEEEMQEGLKNLEMVHYQVDYVITHCASNRIQKAIESHYKYGNYGVETYKNDVLTDYLDKLEDELQYKRWYCGHYHDDFHIDEKHVLLYQMFEKIQ